jgi:hypothetical protein
MAEGMAIRFLNRASGRSPDVSKYKRRDELAREILQVSIVPHGFNTAENAGNLPDPIPPDSEAVTIGGRRTQPRMKALVNHRMRGFEQNLL